MKAIMYEQSRLIAHQSQRLVIKEKILSLPGNSFDIKNVDGRVVFRVDGRIIPFSGRKHVRNAEGEHLFNIRQKLLALHTTFFCEDIQGKRFFKVKRQFSMCKFFITLSPTYSMY